MPKAALIAFARGGPGGPGGPGAAAAAGRDGAPYRFSADADVRAAEKKLRRLVRLERGAGRLAPGAVEAIFRRYDPDGGGSVLRCDFVLCLMELGLSLLDADAAAPKGGAPDAAYERKLDALRRTRAGRGSADSKSISAPKSLSALSKAADGAKGGGALAEEMEQLALLRWYREGRKKEVVKRLLSRSLTSDAHLFPRFGECSYFLFPVQNPFQHEETLCIELEDDALRVVTDAEEWRLLERNARPSAVASAAAAAAAVEADMIYRDPAAPPGSRLHLSLLPGERVLVPFAYLSLAPPGPKREERRVDVAFRSRSHGHAVALLRVHVHPRAAAVHRSLYLAGGEGEVLRRCVRLAAPSWDEDRLGRPGGLFVHTVDMAANRVVVEWREAEGTPEVWIKYRVPAFPGGGSFFVLLYGDEHRTRLLELWHVTVAARLRLDLHATLGQAVTADLVVRGDSYTRRVRALSSAPADVSFAPWRR